MGGVTADSELRPVLVPAVNNVRPIDSRKPSAKPHRKAEKAPHVKANDEKVKLPVSLVDSSPPSPPVLDHRPLLRSDLPLNLSCSSSESSSSRASSRRSSTPIRRKHFSPKADKIEKTGGRPSVASDNCALQAKRRCAWVTPNTGMFVFVHFPLLKRIKTVQFSVDFVVVSFYLESKGKKVRLARNVEKQVN
ncbi:hypothetical protein CK203_046607 [Vitis vinifera]|uniref:Uncharacterized protein n=1 Tax=Vitis vinifera TaxID=29760 RepID=A0A438HL87_VITVI|nr:hypothetical protein CK203_046607 [Vitis vinifera]